MRVFVTGANGHIGSHVVRSAVRRGWHVIAFVREGADLRGLAGVDVELRRGDLLDAAAVKAAMEGADAVIHVGAAHRMVAKDAAAITEPAVSGTRNVLDAMKARGLRRLVYTSTGATIGFTRDPARPLDESHFFRAPKGAYTRGKVEAEQLVLGASHVDAVVLNPSGVFGPGDWRITPATRGLIGVLQGDPALFGLHLTDVRDVGEGHAVALERGEPGTRTLLVGDGFLPAQLAATFAEVTGIKPSTFRPPGFLLRFVVGRAEKQALAHGTDAAATVEALEDLAGGHLLYDGTRARERLGLQWRPGREVLRDAVRWLLARDALKPKVAAKVRAFMGAAAAPDAEWTAAA